MLLAKREKRRIVEEVASFISKPFQYFAPTMMTTPLDILAKAMIRNTLYSADAAPASTTEIVSNERIFELGKLYDQKTE